MSSNVRYFRCLSIVCDGKRPVIHLYYTLLDGIKILNRCCKRCNQKGVLQEMTKKEVGKYAGQHVFFAVCNRCDKWGLTNDLTGWCKMCDDERGIRYCQCCGVTVVSLGNRYCPSCEKSIRSQEQNRELPPNNQEDGRCTDPHCNICNSHLFEEVHRRELESRRRRERCITI